MGSKLFPLLSIRVKNNQNYLFLTDKHGYCGYYSRNSHVLMLVTMFFVLFLNDACIDKK